MWHSNNNSGGISPNTAKGRGAIDRTDYGLTRAAVCSFDVSRCTTSSAHLMSLAAVKNDAMAIRKRLLAKKQLLCTAAPAASAFGGSA